MAPGPTPTLMMEAPARTRSPTPAAVTTLPAHTGVRGTASRTAATASTMRSWCPWAVSTTMTSTPAATSSAARPAGSPFIPIAAPIRNRPAPSMAGR